jgi:Na+/melibiose symporter-like transporter
MSDADRVKAAAAELARYEAERRERIERRSKQSWRIVAWVCAAALVLLGYDSAAAAVGAQRHGKPWIYPVIVAVACVGGLVWLAIRFVRHLKAGRSR